MSTTQPLDPLNFLAIAREVAVGGTDAHFRTAISRAYYCCFLIARDGIGVTGTKDIHKRVITAIRGLSGYWAVADELDNLRKLRVIADYQLVPMVPGWRNWHRNWARAQRIVNDILPLLRSI